MFGAAFDQGLLASMIAASVSTAGLLSMLFVGDWGRRNSSYFSAFAIGLLLTGVVFHLAPEALSMSPHAWKAGLYGFLAMTAFAFILRTLPKRRQNGDKLAFGYASLIALGFHSFLDGVIYKTSFHDHAFTGIISTLGLMLHEFPEGVIAFFLLRSSGAGATTSAIFAFAAASLTTVAGAVFATFFFNLHDNPPIGLMLGATAGALIYVMVFHLGPHASLTPQKRGYFLASLGVTIGMAAIMLRHVEHVH